MNRIAIYNNCTFSYIAVEAILRDLNAVACVTQAKSRLDLIDIDFVFFIVNECNLLQYSEFFLKYCMHLPSEKIIIIGESESCKLFNTIVGFQYKNIDITLPLSDMKSEINLSMLENKVTSRMKKIQIAITPVEIEIIKMLSNGFSLTQIAVLKKRSLKTISHHKCSFFRKLGIENRVSNLLKLVS